ncbi:MAG TPA: polyphosphate polymerase domain-containing protein [Candidatus Paceibacterota bacterium]|nr:polyphosphate polymerase domain-containing protein [Candidatus Paceibacterota bacterium]
MPQDNLQPQRFELKYLVTEDVARAMRDFVRCYLVPDEYAAHSADFSYPNHSLYLDSDDLLLYWDVINGNKNRYKLRLRFYNDDPASPIFFEIKRRSDNAILKERGAVRRDAVATLLAGHLPGPEHLVINHPKQFNALQNFCRLMHETKAVPKTHVAYMREAWMSPMDNSVRVTFDRDVCSVPHSSPVITTHIENPVMPWRNLVILEIKFTSRFPNWFLDMVRSFNVMQCGVAKYAEGVALLGEERMNPTFYLPEQTDRVERFIREHRLPHGQKGTPTDSKGLSWTTS